MSLKPRADFFIKNLFSFIIISSLAIHALIIFLSPKVNQIFKLSSLRESFIREPAEYVVTLEVENTDTQKEQAAKTEAKQDEIETKKEKEPEKKKYKTFTDTTDNTKDEEVNIDTDKIGEKGSLAKDNFPDDKQPVNNEPHAEGHSNAPLLGKGEITSPKEKQQPVQKQEGITETVVSENTPSGNKNSPPLYANLPQGLERLAGSTKHLQTSQSLPQHQTSSKEREEKISEVKSFTSDTMIKTEDTEQIADTDKMIEREQPSKSERLTMGTDGTDSKQEKLMEPLPGQEGVLFTDKQDEIDKESAREKEPLPSSPPKPKTTKKEAVKAEKLVEKFIETKEIQNSDTPEPETPIPPSELPDIEPQRRLERGLDEQESQSELKEPTVSFTLNAKKDASNKDPILFEDTISNSAIPGAPSFNVKKHEYADYFKHIRDRVSLYWFLGYGTRAEIKLETKNDKPIVVEFKVLPNGSIDDVKIIDDAGNFPLASRLIFSVKNAAPLNPFPPNIKEPSIDVKFNFYFF